MRKDSQPAFPVIGIGGAAAGIEALRQFFDRMPADCDMAFVVIVHLPAAHEGTLGENLACWTSMPVLELSPGETMVLQPNHIYVPVPHSIVALSDGYLQIGQRLDKDTRQFRPIDGFFDALGAAMQARAVGIVFSGTGSDGALGLKALKASGGITIAQATHAGTPRYGELPGGVLANGAADLVAPLEDIPGHLLRLTSRPLAAQDSDEGIRALEERRLEICSVLRRQLKHDFSGYRSQTLLRRVERRMRVVDIQTIEDYIARLRSDTSEANSLCLDLLLRVTSFFDSETFALLASVVLPQLFEGKGADSTVRVWVPGCATGEEAYSLAILLREHLDSLPAAPKVQVFASDIDEAAICTARLGRYPTTLLAELSTERRQRFFTFSQGSHIVNKEIRDLCRFSLHNIVDDPPLSTMNWVSCRNLLTYMDPQLQKRVVPLFHYALVPSGILLLGGAEPVAPYSELFDTLHGKARIFRRRESRSLELDFHGQRSHLDSRGHYPSEHARAWSLRSVSTASTGVADPRGNSAGASPSVRFKDLLADETVDAAIVARLKSALSAVSEELRYLAGQHQTALEELRSSNEELHSVNEEMQSTNEELETSKEEMQSLNEELHSVNLRLTEKLEELDHTNSDLKNLFDSTRIATAFLDRQLRIRSFTPAIASLYNLIPSDHGRPLTDIVSQLRYTGLREDVALVLSTVEPLERRIVRQDGTAHYIMRILPYREPDSTVSGVLVTFVDVTSIMRAEAALVEADARKDIFLATLSHELRNPLAPIRIAAQLLQSPKLRPAELAQAQAIITRQVKHMSSLLDDLLDISRITRGSFPLKIACVDIRALVDEAVESVQSALEAKGHLLRLELPETPITVKVDPVRITQAITNLLTNAVKYTPSRGQIHLSVRLDGQYLSFAVRDNGVGLTAEAMRKVFDMFTRVESHVTRSEGGLGIGLALAKGLVHLHGGQLEVRSAGSGQGSEFFIRLPRSVIIDNPPLPRDIEEAKPTIPRRRILVADDNRDAAESLSMLLKLDGHEVHTAHTGMQALEIAQELCPDVGIFDIGMPELNGYELAERIRHEAWGKNMTLIAVTGWGQEGDKRRALLAGFDHHLTKPIAPEQIEGLFEASATEAAA